MPLNAKRASQLLAKGDLRNLFIEELGWDRHNATLEIVVRVATHKLYALGQKRGMVAYHCPTPAAQRLPDHAQRRKIEQQVAKSAHEHLIVFADAANETQIWQWVKREPGKPAACREHTFHRSQSGEALLQKISAIAFTLEEEERLSLVDVASRARAGFDVEKITKRFYDRFQKEHTAFLKFIKGITERADHEWYASVMLNRLMFVYFIQRKGFLDGDQNYLRNRLRRMREEQGANKFYSFYRYFLLRLFHEGLGGRKRSGELEKLIGRIPYLNGGLFDVHELERPDRYGQNIQIPDQAFERIFDYFDGYQWHLDERPLRDDKEINPDVLGYIFEKYINQKQMGAYYTKEDITEYISKYAVIPFLLDAARAKCTVAFENSPGPTVWDLLKDDPDRYIYPALRHGITWDYQLDNPHNGVPLEKTFELPREIIVGLTPPTLHQLVEDGPVLTLEARKAWNRSASATHALPTETWREVIDRRKHYEEVKAKLAAGEIRNVNDLITYNLDIRQFAQDVIENCEGPELLRAFWHSIEKATILDPTCGSGAFLFAALNILEPLYEACLDRMQTFVEDLDRSAEEHRPDKFSDFREVLQHVDKHPNRRYFIFKSIILNNLYGVDIMEEAVEICKLRLFLKLAAQVSPDTARDNLGIEPLPDIDFNIRAGNSLVGYATFDEVLKSAEGDWLRQEDIETIKIRAADLQQTFDAFRAGQVDGDGAVSTELKQQLRGRLAALGSELNRYLATEYGIHSAKKDSHAKWLRSHQPFHWFIEFYGIMKDGGFDVIIGNPPYVELNKVTGYKLLNYESLDCGNLYPLCVERSSTLLSINGSFSMIVPLSGFSTERMETYQNHVWNRYQQLHISYYSGDAHPSVMFNGVKYRLCIIIGKPGQNVSSKVQTSQYMRWYAVERPCLFPKLAYSGCSFVTGFLRFAKIGNALAARVLEKIVSKQTPIGSYIHESGAGHITYHRSPVFWIRSMDFEPYFKSATKDRSTDHLKDIYFDREADANRIGALLNSTLFYLWFTTQGNCRNVAGPDIFAFPIGDLRTGTLAPLKAVFRDLMKDLQRNSQRRVYTYEASGKVEYDEFYPDESKSIIDKIDQTLAQHFLFTEEELDFIINYDIKYRMGREAETEEES